MYTLTAISVYPIKSLGGIALQEAQVGIRGLEHDRRWMLVNEAGRFMTQREIPDMALLRTAFETAHLVVYHKDHPADVLRIPLDPVADHLEPKQVSVWGDSCQALLLSKDINNWFSAVLGHSLQLVWMPETTRRTTDQRYVQADQHVSFADGFPYLIIGQATLDDLNRRLDAPLPMNRFRPNFVFSGGRPFEEDHWDVFSIDGVPFQGVKPCARCAIPTIDQETGMQAAEPIKTLSTFRSSDKKILFGQNVVWLGTSAARVRVGGVIRLGDEKMG